MALRLRELPTEPHWFPVGSGAEVLALPPTTPRIFAARAQAEAMAVALAEAGEVVTRAGGRIVGAPDIETPTGRDELRHALFAVALAELVIIDWRGILADTKADEAEPLAFAPHHLANLMADASVAERFVAAYYQPLHEVVTEGNV